MKYKIPNTRGDRNRSTSNVTHLSANVPKTIFPTKMPNMKIVCDVFARYFLLHTKSHVIWIVSVKISRLNVCALQSAEHLSVIFGSAHVKLTFGAVKMILIWCHATGNFNKNINAHTMICHRPSDPIACWIGSDFEGSVLIPLLPTAVLFVPLDSTSIATIETKWE